MRRLGQWLAWWVFLAALWLGLVAKVQPSYLVAGTAAAALGASVAVTLTALGLGNFQVHWAWLRVAARLPGNVLRDCVVVFAALGRRLILRAPVEGLIRDLPFEPGGDDPDATGRRALVVFGVGLSPNTVVTAIDRDACVVRVHQLVPTPETPGRGDRRWPV